MAVDLEQFRGVLPYSAELFGVYQPVLGWKSKRTLLRLQREHQALVGAALKDVIRRTPGRSELLRAPRPLGPDDMVPDHFPSHLRTKTARKLRASAMAFFARHDRAPEGDEWKQVLEDANLAAVVVQAAEARRPGGKDGSLPVGPTLKQEAVVAGTLEYIAQHAPQSLANLLQIEKAVSALLHGALDPLSNFDPAGRLAVLSPIGLINVYREYFFEFDTFLGPPVGHVWVSPGGSLELFEVHTRRTIQERQVELATETTTRTETEVAEQDEISSAIAEENADNISLGVSASASAKLFSVVEASASASFGYQTNTKESQEHAHKHLRSQSEKVANEIRRNFKTTFKTTAETEDISSRRYLLQNTTDTLVNYELRRKLRQVGVQVQHLATQLCWQVYVDNPGYPLGISTLVHAAQPEDLLPDVQPPEAPTEPPTKKDQYVYVFPFEPKDEEAMDDGGDEDYVEGQDVEEDPGVGQIVIEKDVTVATPQNAAGYQLQSATIVSADPLAPGEDPAVANASCEVIGPDTFRIHLHEVNFNDQPGIRFTIDLVWKAPQEVRDKATAEYDSKLALYEDQKKRAAHTAYVKVIRERIKLASNVRLRRGEDLREEERTVVYRELIRRLTGIDSEADPHLIAELIRGIFDVERMLYYVAPEWWMPRKRSQQEFGPSDPSDRLTAEDKVSWGGAKATGGWLRWGRPNYMITEDSEPAPLGASLGWLIQLDGDAHRNAFLNSPWVKAVLPIRPGREAAAVEWLKLAHVEGTLGLDAKYAGPEEELQGKTIGEAMLALAGQVASLGESIDNVLATETVYENGFDPLAEGFRATGEPFEVFDQWIEVLPTDQVVAVEYFAD